jgi:hypothetical protein
VCATQAGEPKLKYSAIPRDSNGRKWKNPSL